MKPKQLSKFLELNLKSKNPRPIHIWGAPGIGKSSITKQVCERLGWGMIDIRCVYLEPCDLIGIPYPKGEETIWLRPRFLPNSNDEMGVLFFDDVCQALPGVMNALSQIVLDNKAGVHNIPKGWQHYVLASNELIHRAATHEMPSHLRTRLIEVHLEADLDDWKEWAYKNGIRSEVISFLNFRPSKLVDCDYTKYTKKACPRMWEVASDCIKIYEDDEDLLIEALNGCLGEGIASEFIGFLRVCKSLPDVKDILAGKDIVPEEPSTLYALCGALVHEYLKAKKQHAERILEYSKLLPPEFSVLLIRDCYKADKYISTVKGWSSWAMKHKDVILE